ncbi:hypothetical protein KGY77_08500 [Candidatus Bipolaricaulota bacterium]|nr:hypothetical protein [Candidatus Bipolaricaulota bacterium]
MKYRGTILSLITLGVFSGSGVLIYLGLVNDQAFAPLIAFGSTLIAVGSSGSFALYREWVKQPYICFGNNIEYSVAPLKASLDEGSSNARIVTPAIYFKLRVENQGRATAQNCMINVTVKENGDHVARWAIPENPERYDLLPGENRHIHLFRATVLPDWVKIVYNDDTNEVLSPGEGKEVGLEPEFPKPITAIDWTGIDPSIEQPIKIFPESKGKSSFGGWVGQKVGYDTCTISVQAIAEDYKTGAVEKVKDLQLSEKTVKVCADKDKWQDQWGDVSKEKEGFLDKSAEIKKTTSNACQELLDRSD